LGGVDASTYWGALAPSKTPPDAINRISTTMAQVLKIPDVNAKLVDLGFDPIGSTPEQHAQVISSEIDKWSRVIKATNIRLD
jgi:tripartite-type tricarboxylate transporter receptor subunit TctC